jgi:hypothetical protein
MPLLIFQAVERTSRCRETATLTSAVRADQEGRHVNWAEREQAISDTRREFVARSSIRMMQCTTKVLGGYKIQALGWLGRLETLSEGANATALSDILALQRQITRQIAEIDRLSLQ